MPRIPNAQDSRFRHLGEEVLVEPRCVRLDLAPELLYPLIKQSHVTKKQFPLALERRK